MAKKKFTAKNIRQGHTVWTFRDCPERGIHVKGYLVTSHNDKYYPGEWDIIDHYPIRFLRKRLAFTDFPLQIFNTRRKAERYLRERCLKSMYFSVLRVDRGMANRMWPEGEYERRPAWPDDEKYTLDELGL